jgi:cysteine desulfurase/selenocysteine lyase
VYDQPLAYLDNAATTQKPDVVIDRVHRFYALENSNVHRGVHFLSQRATDAFESARSTVAHYINCTPSEVVFTTGTTGAINLVASGLGASIGVGDEVIISSLEHHSNIVPWQMMCERSGATLRVIPVDDSGVLDLAAYEQLLSEKTRIVAVAHTSNAIGTVNPIVEMTRMAHSADALVLVDAAQAFAHGPVDVVALDADFVCFSGHKMFGPTGIGVLYGRKSILETLPPYQGGGDMIETVTFESSTYAELPHRLEAGTPNIAGVLGLAAAVEYLSALEWSQIAEHENHLTAYATARLGEFPGVHIVGTAPEKAAVISFVYDSAHPYDVGTVLDRMGVAVRTGHHCAMPLMKRFGLPGTVRASFALYNNEADVDLLMAGMRKVKSLFG